MRSSAGQGLRLAAPAALDRQDEQAEVTPWSVEPEAYGDFLIAVFEEWVRHDVGKVFVMNFEWALNAWIGNPSPVCVHAKQCGRSLVIEHNGDVYACDHCVYPAVPARQHPDRCTAGHGGEIARSPVSALPRKRPCRAGAGNAMCWQPAREGAPSTASCPRTMTNRGFTTFARGTGNFSCTSGKYLQVMAQLLENGLPVALVMEALKRPLVINLGEAGNTRIIR